MRDCSLEKIDFQTVMQNQTKADRDSTLYPNQRRNPNSIILSRGENIVYIKKEFTLKEYGIYKRFKDITFSEIERIGLPNNPSIRKNYRIVKDYAKHIYENIENGVGLFMLGDCGTMKTTMSIAVMRELIDDNVDYPPSCYFISMTNLLDTIFSMNNASKEEAARFERKIRNTDLLVIDDLGSENTEYNWVKSKIDSIITERYNRMLPCIISSNLTFDELAKTYASRIIDRLRSANKALIFSGQSVRP